MPRNALKKPRSPQAPNPPGAGSVSARGVQPVTVPTGLPYGENASLAADQKAVKLPMSNGSAGLPSASPGPAPTAGPGGSAPVDFNAAAEAAKGFTASATPLNAPTQRPDEPITAGLPSPQAGSMGGGTTSPGLAKGAAILNALGDKVDPATAKLRHYVNGMMGNQAAP